MGLAGEKLAGGTPPQHLGVKYLATTGTLKTCAVATVSNSDCYSAACGGVARYGVAGGAEQEHTAGSPSGCPL